MEIKIKNALERIKEIIKIAHPLFLEANTLKKVKKDLNTLVDCDYIEQARDSLDSIIEYFEFIETSLNDTVDMLESVEFKDE